MEIPLKKGSLLGGILLVAGCCIGAGMLGLPVLSAKAGFIPSSATFFLCWVFMLATGLLLLEVNLRYGKDISIITMAEKTLGFYGKAVSWFVYLFLFYSLMVAYVAASGSLVTDFFEQVTGKVVHFSIGSFLFCLLFGYLIYLGTKAVDWFNRLLMIGLILAYALLIMVGAKSVKLSNLIHSDWSSATLAIPAVIVSFGFHNMIPSLNNYMHGNVTKLKWTLIVGSFIPFLIYLAWEWLILGIVPAENFVTALDQGEMATQALRNATGASWVTDVAELFAFFAIITSFLSVALSFVDFLADGLKIEKTKKWKIILIGLVLAPPFVFAIFYPTVFLMALNYAGGFGAVILFGILPALMAWKNRYHDKIRTLPLVPGGKPILILIIAFAIWVIALQFF